LSEPASAPPSAAPLRHGGVTCELCGRPVGTGRTEQVSGGGLHHFCCPGCRQVFLLLAASSGDLPFNFRQTDLYRACVEAGIIPEDRSVFGVTEPREAIPDGSAIDLSMRVEGMWCPACAWLIEEILKKTSGVCEPRVSFMSDTVRLRYLPHLVSPTEILSRVGRLGYHVSLPEGGARLGAAKRDLLVRLGISAILTMNVMMFSYALYAGFIRDLAPTVVASFSYPLLAVTAPVVFYGGMPILRKAWAGLLLGRASMDTLIAVSAMAAFCYSVLQVARGSIHLYFDTAAMLVTIVLFGRYIEMHARERVLAAATFDEISLHKVRLPGGPGEQWADADALQPGDRFVVFVNERVPLDGRITEGRGLLDQSALTGEARPVALQPGDQVLAGSLLVDGDLQIMAIRLARESRIRQMADLMARALEQKNSGEQIADAASRIFVPVMIAVAGASACFFRLSGLPADEIILRCLTILLISCPCALGIAVPLVKVAVVGLGGRRGILIKNPEALERVRGLDTMVLDKTGTMTEGRFTLRQVICDETDERGVLSRIGAIEAASSHLLALEIMRRVTELGLAPDPTADVEEFEGMGVSGMAGEESVVAGNRRLLSHCRVNLPPVLDDRAAEQERMGMTVVFFGWKGRARGFLVFGDCLREGAVRLVEWMKDRGMRVILLSGDGEKTTQAVARDLCVADFLGQVLPHEKAEAILKLQRQGHKVGMVGDGVNDAGALAQADVSFAFGTGHDVTREASDLVIPSGKPAVIMDVFRLSSLSVRTVRQNLSFAFLYNATAVPIAAAGLLNPVVAVLAMFASSLTVIGNSLRIARGARK
jgi:heavy metal translocating P-type ATPase